MAEKSASIFPKSHTNKWFFVTVLSFCALVSHEADVISMDGLNPMALNACSTIPIHDELPKSGYNEGEALYLIRSDGTQPQVLIFPLGEHLSIVVMDASGSPKTHSGVLRWVDPQSRTLTLINNADRKKAIPLKDIKRVDANYEDLRWRNVTTHGAFGASIGMLGVSAVGGLFALAILSSGATDDEFLPIFIGCVGVPLMGLSASVTSASCCAGASLGYLGTSIDDARFPIDEKEWRIAASPQEVRRRFPALQPIE